MLWLHFFRFQMAGVTKFKTANDIPSPYRQLFECLPSTEQQLQDAWIENILNGNDHVVVCASEEPWKTVAFELAIVRLLLFRQSDDGAEPLKMPTIVYVTATKAQCVEKHSYWAKRLQSIGLSCRRLSGEVSVADLQQTQLVMATVEKWDALMINARESLNALCNVRLFMVDEVQVLGDDVRGPIVEVIVARMKRLFDSLQQFPKAVAPRFVVVSPAYTNSKVLALWMSTGKEQGVVQLRSPSHTQTLSVQKHVIGVNSKHKYFRFDLNMNYRLANLIRRFAEEQPTLVYCSSRKSAEMAANVIEKERNLFALNATQKAQLYEISLRLQDRKLQTLVVKGISYHHAGLAYQDRLQIEEAFNSGLIMVLLCTNTCGGGGGAMHLQAQLVIIKSTETYNAGVYSDYTDVNVLQMLNSAGKTGCKRSANFVILTYSKNVVSPIKIKGSHDMSSENMQSMLRGLVKQKRFLWQVK